MKFTLISIYPEQAQFLETRKFQLNEIARIFNNICDVLEGKAELIVKPEQSLRVMKVIDLLFRATEEGHGFKCEI